MSNRHWKKAVAIATAAMVVLAGIPGLPDAAYADTDTTATTQTTTTDTTQAADGTTADGTATDAAAADGTDASADGDQSVEKGVGKVAKKDWITKKDYELVTESDSYKMYLYKPRLSILLEDKKTGKLIESTLSDEKDDGLSNASWNAYMKSGLVLTAIKGIKNNIQVDLVSTQNTIDVTNTDNGFTANITYPEYGFSLTVNVSLENDQLVVNIPDDSIKETMDGYYISTVTMFPFMGYSYLDDKEGYMLIPDGNGALINLDNKNGRYNIGFNQRIYGSDAGFKEADTKTYLWEKLDMLKDANEVIAPIFGMAHTKDEAGYLAIVEKGEKRANIVAEPNGVTVNYNRCYAKFLLRDIYVQPLNNSSSGSVQKAENDRTHSDLQVRYMLLSKGETDYSTMANKYRQYLLDNKLVTKQDNTYSTRVDFLGTDREEFLLGTRAVTMTKAEDIQNIFTELQGNGVSSLFSIYKGWQDGGLYNVPITSYDADSHIGGDSKVADLVKDSAAKNYNVYLYADALRMNPSNNALNYNMIKRVNKRTYEEEVQGEVYKSFYYLEPQTATEDFKKFVASAAKKEINKIAVSGISNTIFSYSFKGDFYTRNDSANAFKSTLDEVNANTTLALEEPAAYLWSNTSSFLDMPLGSSDYMYIDEEVPFLSMVLKGIIPMYSNYVNFEANKEEFKLQMIEAGVFPSFYITEKDSSALIYTNSSDLYSTAYATYKDMIVKYDKEFRQFSSQIGDATITKHEKMNNGITKVTYSNGVSVYVNYSDTAKTVDGVTVGSMSYTTKAGDAE